MRVVQSMMRGVSYDIHAESRLIHQLLQLSIILYVKHQTSRGYIECPDNSSFDVENYTIRLAISSSRTY